MRSRLHNIALVERYITENLQEPLTLAQLAAHFNISISVLSKLFRRRYGIPIHQHVLKTKMEKACQLLKNTNCTVAEVANQVGYKELSNFSRTFTRYFNMRPSVLIRSLENLSG